MQENRDIINREDIIKEHNAHMAQHSQGYYKVLNAYNNYMTPNLRSARGPFSKEGWDEILSNDALWGKSVEYLKNNIFKGNSTLQNRFTRLMNNTREVANSVDRIGRGLEGWGGGSAIYASSHGAFAFGATPFIIGGWQAAARSEEIYQYIDNKNNIRLEFEYNIDYLLIGETKKYFPQAFRDNDGISGFNNLPAVDWVTKNSPSGSYTAPFKWCGADQAHAVIELKDSNGDFSYAVQGNLIKACKENIMKVGIEPNCKLTHVKFKKHDGGEFLRVVNLNYDVATGPTNERIFKLEIKFEPGSIDAANEVIVSVYMKINLDIGEFTLMTVGFLADRVTVYDLKDKLIGFAFYGRFSNIANEFTNIPTTGVEKFQFIRECEYKNYSKVSLNEYMADNFTIGSNNSISYAAYATDKMLQFTIYNRELEGEDYFQQNLLSDSVNIAHGFELYRKFGGFINNKLTFNAARFAPGMRLQEYKEGLKLYLFKSLAIADTDLHIPASVKREWYILCYSVLAEELPQIQFENNALSLDGESSTNENYGFTVEGTRCGSIDNLGRQVKIISNNDGRWATNDRRSVMWGALRTYTMEYPFLVYYPHAIRMFTAIDADNPNRTAIVIGGREFRGHFAAGAFKLKIQGVMNTSSNAAENLFDAQMKDAHTFKTT